MDHDKSKPLARRESVASVEGPKGIFRTTLAYDEQSMLCHFRLAKGAHIPMHHHLAAQNGYLISGRMRFVKETGEGFIAEPGTGWCFASEEPHGADVLEDSEAVECFVPMRADYLP
jgi:quercetin dioxygenase-like cupin family protein